MKRRLVIAISTALLAISFAYTASYIFPVAVHLGQVPDSTWGYAAVANPYRFEISVFRGKATVVMRWYAEEWKAAYNEAIEDKLVVLGYGHDWAGGFERVDSALRKETSSLNQDFKIGPVLVRSRIDVGRPIRAYWLFFPLWLPCTGIVFFLAVYLLPPLIRLWSRKRKGLCRACGYDLTGNLSGMCPECATPILSVAKGSRVKKTPDEDG